MKWIFAWNDAALERYGDLIRVAVESARRNTSLEMHCLHDGQATAFTRWLGARGVQLHAARFRFAAQLEHIARERGEDAISRIGLGAYLRLEIPSLTEKWGWDDEFVFYTDIDVLFLRDPVPLIRSMRPRFFAAAPELWPGNLLHMNTGVMLLHLTAMRRVEVPFLRFVERHLETSIASSWDQGVLRAYFDPLHRLAWQARVPDRWFYTLSKRSPFSRHQWDALPPELNWKPYWGLNADAVIVHFHGVKPWHRAQIEREGVPPSLAPTYGPGSLAWCHEWERWRAELESLPVG